LNSEPFRNGSILKSASTSLASIWIMLARISRSENTAAKRSVGFSCARAGRAEAAAIAAPPARTERRLTVDFMTLLPEMTFVVAVPRRPLAFGAAAV
jgi:hypothetical protein